VKLRHYISLVILLSISCLSGAQTSFSTRGKEFWLGYLNNFNGSAGPVNLQVSIVSDYFTSGTVSVPGQGWSASFSVVPGATATVNIPLTAALPDISSAVLAKGIHILSEDTVSVFAYNVEDNSMDGNLVLPVQSIGTEYMLAAWEGINVGSEKKSACVIVATENNTEVEIIPTCNVESGPAGTAFTVLLNQGDIYYLKGATAQDDLTGTVVRGTQQSGHCRPFSVFSGSECATVPNTCLACDHLVEQMYPISTWGTAYCAVPFSGMTGYTYRVIASENATYVTIDNGIPTLLQAGQFLEFNGVLSPRKIVADAPIAVVQYMEGISCSGTGDPSMVWLNPMEHKMRDITFSTPDVPFIEDNFVTLVVRAADAGSMMLDGAVIVSPFIPFAADPSFVWTSVFIPPGTHSLSASGDGFIGYIYGNGSINGAGTYAHPIGSFRNWQAFDITDIYCTTDTVVLEVDEAQTDYTNYRWAYYGISNSVLSTDESYTVIPPINNALFQVQLQEVASGCDTTFYYSVESPLPPIVTVTPSATEICVLQSIELFTIVTPIGGLYSYTWIDGSGLHSTTDSAPVATPSETSNFTVQVSTLGGCATSTASAQVVVTPSLITRFSVSPDRDQICAGEQVNMEVVTEKMIWGDNFDPSVSWGDWQIINNGDASTLCGSVTDNALYFTGTGTRSAVTPLLDVSSGGTIYFALKIASGVAPCDNAEPGDNVQLSYRTSSGAWTVIQTFAENAFPDFVPLEIQIPIAAISGATQFRWQQTGSWAGAQDNWCLDDVYIAVENTAELDIVWSPSTGLDDPFSATPTASPTTTAGYLATVSDGPFGCVYTDSVYIVVGQLFDLNLTPDTAMCDVQGIGLQVAPSLPGDYTYIWSPDDGSIAGLYSASPVVNPPATSTYYVTAYSEFGCEATASTQVEVVGALDLQITASDYSTCSGEQIDFTAAVAGGASDLAFLWKLGTDLLGTGTSYTAFPTNDATYTVTVTDVSSGCALSEDVFIDVTPAFTVGIQSGDILSCQMAGTPIAATVQPGGAYNWEWQPASAVVNATSPVTELATNYTGPLEVLAITADGCVSFDAINLTFVDETVDLGADREACQSNLVTLDSGAPEEYTIVWSTGESTPSVVAQNQGVYTVVVYSPLGCITSDQVYVTYFQTPEVDLGPEAFFCPGGSAQLTTAAEADAIIWYPTGESTSTITVTEPGQYICVASLGVCSGSDTIRVSYSQVPKQPFGADTTVCFQESANGAVLRVADTSYTCIWQGVEVGSTYFASAPGVYSVEITNTAGCVAEYSIEMSDFCPGALWVPNAFTPDGDNVNDTWEIKGDNVGVFKLLLYNKWGERIYETEDIQAFWNGQRRGNGETVPPEAYFYRITYQLLDEDGELMREKDMFGFVTVVR
jgi:gliding motility-associated-like protein